MAISQKYGRTFHYPFSPGTESDDRIQYEYWQHLQQMKQIVHTEKLDGENNCMSTLGVFARSHAAPTTSPWTETLRIFWQRIRNELGTMEIFLENLYAIHSIEYKSINHHFYVFAIRDRDHWLGWEETKFYAGLLDLPVVPEISITQPAKLQSDFEKEVMSMASGAGSFQPCDAKGGNPVTMEGIVTRNYNGYTVDAFADNVFKYVRKGHVKTDQHWTRNWKRAKLQQEGGKHVDL